MSTDTPRTGPTTPLSQIDYLAGTVEVLTQENATLRATVARRDAEMDSLKEMLAEALLPLARLGGPNDGFPAFHDLPDDVVIYSNSGASITAGDVRRARALLTSHPEGGDARPAYEHGPWCEEFDLDQTETMMWLAERLEPFGKELADFGPTVKALEFLFASRPAATPALQEQNVALRDMIEGAACILSEVGYPNTASEIREQLGALLGSEPRRGIGVRGVECPRCQSTNTHRVYGWGHCSDCGGQFVSVMRSEPRPELAGISGNARELATEPRPEPRPEPEPAAPPPQEREPAREIEERVAAADPELARERPASRLGLTVYEVSAGRVRYDQGGSD